MTTRPPITPWNPSRRATAKVTNPLPIPESCRYCASVVRVVTNDQIYNGRQYGEWPWVCLCDNAECGAYVGFHPFTGIPLGTLARRPLRDARKQAKALFNPFWESGRMTRGEAYASLAKAMGIPELECHFGWFDEAQCQQAIDHLSNPPHCPQNMNRAPLWTGARKRSAQ